MNCDATYEKGRIGSGSSPLTRLPTCGREGWLDERTDRTRNINRKDLKDLVAAQCFLSILAISRNILQIRNFRIVMEQRTPASIAPETPTSVMS